MKILFLCNFNRFRSKVSEAIFLKLDNGKNEVKSAGFTADLTRPFVAQSVHTLLKNKGYSIENEKTRQVDSNMIKWADYIVVVASDVDKDIMNVKLKGKKFEQWKVPNCTEFDEQCIKDGVDVMEMKVKDFVKRLEKGQILTG